jgi:hypothetical protein
MAQRELDAEQRQQTRKQIERIKELSGQHQTASDEDSWTSRPIRVWVVRAVPGKSRIALESGLADVLPWMLADGLTQVPDGPLQVVERELLPEMLAEQELSAQLSSEKDRLRLGNVLGARVLLECRFDALKQKDYALVTATDTETTMRIPVKRIDLPRGFDPDAWVKELCLTVAQAVAHNYPVRGRLSVGENGPRLNIGREVGVHEGMQFQVSMEPDQGMPLPEKRVVVASPVEARGAPVQLEGFEEKDIPSEGWYAFAEEAGAG